jgi:hypothetical protein
MPAQPPPAGPGVYFVATIIILVAVLFVGMLLLRLSAYLATRRTLSYEQKQRYGVKRFEPPRPFAQVPRPEWLHMSSQARPPEPRIVAVPGTAGTNQGPPVPTPSLTYDAVFRDTVLLKNKQGGWQHSGKKLYALWGGNHDEFLAKVRSLRGETAPDSAAASSVGVSPIAGRPYDPRQFHSDNPELQYVDP